MSEVMKALKQSEQAYQAQSTPQIQPSGQYIQPKSSMNRWLLALLMALPIISVLIAWGTLNKASSNKTIVRQDDPQDLVVPSVLETNEVKFAKVLPYPEIHAANKLPATKPVTALKPLPAVRVPSNKVASTTARSDGGTIIKTDQVNMDDPNNDWGVNELDLSNISPELAERFKTALNSQARNKKKQSTESLSVPSNTINLVGNEQQYYDRLPKMDFETHMYSSNTEKRWIKVNGKELHEGDWIIEDQVQLEKILPGSTVILFNGQLIQIPALYEWYG